MSLFYSVELRTSCFRGPTTRYVIIIAAPRVNTLDLSRVMALYVLSLPVMLIRYLDSWKTRASDQITLVAGPGKRIVAKCD